jgi:hypothetical protein
MGEGKEGGGEGVGGEGGEGGEERGKEREEERGISVIRGCSLHRLLGTRTGF